jgi:DNA-binding MarR family transcriptional regulator
MNALPENIPDCTIFLLAKAYQKAHARFMILLQPYGLTSLQHLVLEALWYQEGYTATELSRHLVLDKATLSGVLERMAEAGWIEKKPDPVDRRAIRLYPAEAANRIKGALVTLRSRANAEVLAPLSLEEQILLKRFLRDIM